MVPDATLASEKRSQVRILNALVIAVNRAQHVRPGRGEDKPTGHVVAFHHSAVRKIQHIRPDAEQLRHYGIICHRLPEDVDDGALLLSHHIVGFRVDRFLHRAQHTQGGTIVLLRPFCARALQRGRVILRDLVPLTEFERFVDRYSFCIELHPCGNGSPSPIKQARRWVVDSDPPAEIEKAPPNGTSQRSMLTNVHYCLQESLAPLCKKKLIERGL